MSTKHKYVRHCKLGIILFPMTHDLFHSHVGHLLASKLGAGLVSAGFAEFTDGRVNCYGMSESLSLGSKPEDSEILAKQLGMKAAK